MKAFIISGTLKNYGKEEISSKFIFNNPRSYFLDYLTINIQIPRKPHIDSELKETNAMLYDMVDALARPIYKDIPEWVLRANDNLPIETKRMSKSSSFLHTKRMVHDHYYGLHISTSKKHHMLKLDFSGRFWSGSVNHRFIHTKQDKMGNNLEYTKTLVKYDGTGLSQPTTNILDDIDLVFEAYKEIEDICNTILANYWRDGRTVFSTISRMDISTQKKTSLQKSIFKSMHHPWFQVKSPKDTYAFPNINMDTGKYASFLIAKINQENSPDLKKRIWLKVYDKNQTIDEMNKLICQTRFGTTNVVRKEWHLRRIFFKSLLQKNSTNKKADIYSLHECIKNYKDNPFLYNLFYNIRKNMDCMFYNDSHRYMAFHDPIARKQLKIIHRLPMYKINQLFQRIKPLQIKNLDLSHMLPAKNHKRANSWTEVKFLTREIENSFNKMNESDKIQLKKNLANILYKK